MHKQWEKLIKQKPNTTSLFSNKNKNVVHKYVCKPRIQK